MNVDIALDVGDSDTLRRLGGEVGVTGLADFETKGKGKWDRTHHLAVNCAIDLHGEDRSDLIHCAGANTSAVERRTLSIGYQVTGLRPPRARRATSRAVLDRLPEGVRRLLDHD